MPIVRTSDGERDPDRLKDEASDEDRDRDFQAAAHLVAGVRPAGYSTCDVSRSHEHKGAAHRDERRSSRARAAVELVLVRASHESWIRAYARHDLVVLPSSFVSGSAGGVAAGTVHRLLAGLGNRDDA